MLRAARSRAFASISETLRRIPCTATHTLAASTWGSYRSGVWGRSVCRNDYSTTIVREARRLCFHDGCSKHPTFGIVQRKPIYCKSHKAEDHEDVVHPRCAFDGCRIISPGFNHPGQKKGLFCAKHKLAGMEDVINIRCNYPGCKKRPSYNHPGEKRALFCVKHKEHGMEDVISSRCAHEGCKTVPVYNYPGEKQGLFCAKHKLVHMEDVRSKRCAYKFGCKTRPVYNHPGEKTGLYCTKHKLEHMVDIISKKCAHEGCNVYTSGSGIRLCSKHRKLAAAEA